MTPERSRRWWLPGILAAVAVAALVLAELCAQDARQARAELAGWRYHVTEPCRDAAHLLDFPTRMVVECDDRAVLEVRNDRFVVCRCRADAGTRP